MKQLEVSLSHHLPPLIKISYQIADDRPVRTMYLSRQEACKLATGLDRSLARQAVSRG